MWSQGLFTGSKVFQLDWSYASSNKYLFLDCQEGMEIGVSTPYFPGFNLEIQLYDDYI